MTKIKSVDRTPSEMYESQYQESKFKESVDTTFLNRGNLWLDPEKFPEGYEWGWVVEKIRHEDVDISGAAQRGWMPIPVGKYPDLHFLKKWKRENEKDADGEQYYRIGGQILCERPIEMKNLIDKHYANISRNADAQVEEFIKEKGLNMDTNIKKYSNRSLDFGN